MFKKLVKKLILAATIAGMAGTLAASFTACNVETDHPEVKISIEFNGETYNLGYTLYRNMYPETVRHFIELADSGFYNDMLIHDYSTSTDWYSGGYAYDEEAYASHKEQSALADYFDTYSKEQEYMDMFEAGKLYSTVYKFNSIAKSPVAEEALPTLYGEFSENQHTIEKGALSAEQGTLKMFYYEKETSQDTTAKVSVFPSYDRQNFMRDYQYNCATSVFAMQVGSSSSVTASRYCVFGRMGETGALTDLLDAISDYYSDNDNPNNTTVSNIKVDTLVDEYLKKFDMSFKDTEVKFTQPAIPIVIRSVKVTKY